MTREDPARPVAAAGGIVLRGDAVLLIRRGVEPYAGRWSLPGGAVELGEEVHEALVREVAEETGLRVEPVALVGVYDRIVREGERIRYHYVLVDYLCRYVSGEPRAGTDAEEARWVALTDLDAYDLTSVTRQAIEGAVALRGDRA